MQVEAEEVTYDINSKEEYLAVYNMYSTQIDKIDLIYPVDITTVNNNAVSLNTDDEVCTLILGCE